MRQKHKRIGRPLILYASSNGYGADNFSGDAVFADYTGSKGGVIDGQMQCFVSTGNGEYDGAYADVGLVNYSMMTTALDCAALRAKGLTKLCFTGNYSVETTVSGYHVYVLNGDNVYSAFAALVSNKDNITVDASGITNAEEIHQISGHTETDGKYINAGFKSLNGDFSGSIPLPERGTVYLVVGALQKNTRARTTLTLTNLWIS